MSTITREWLQQAINDYESVRDEIPFGLDDYQGNILAALRIALASLEAEAVATFHKSECGNVFNTLDSWLPVEGVNKLYAEPQLPQPAAPNNAAAAIRACLDEFPEDVRDIVEECASIAENACRAAMLQDSEPATDNTNQQFESLSRGDK